MRRTLVLGTVAALCLSLSIPAVANPFEFPRHSRQGLGSGVPPQVTAPSWILYDASTGAVLASQNSAEIRAPASITKIMTVLLALENGSEADQVRISSRAANTGEREIGVWAGETVSLGALMRAALIHSANDAATAIAEHIGGSVEGFADLMNSRARELGMTRTNFVNPHGLDVEGHLTSAEDMLKLGIAAMEREDFRAIANARIVVFPNAPNGGRRVGTSTNLLVGAFEGANGVKTGFTNRAGLTFVASAERDGRELHVVVLGSQGQRAHLADARALFTFGFDDLRAYGVLGGQPFKSSLRTATPSPTDMAASMEALVHIAGGGLFDFEPPEVPPDPILVVNTVHRRSDPVPHGFWSAIGYWARSVLGS